MQPTLNFFVTRQLSLGKEALNICTKRPKKKKKKREFVLGPRPRILRDATYRNENYFGYVYMYGVMVS